MTSRHCSKQLLHLLQIINPNGNKYILPVPKRLIGVLRLKNYILIEPTVYGSVYGAQIVRIIDAEYKRFYELNKVWPKKFDDPDLGVLGAPIEKKKKKPREEKPREEKKKDETTKETKEKIKKPPKIKTEEESAKDIVKENLVATTQETKKKPKKKPQKKSRKKSRKSTPETSKQIEADLFESTENETETDDSEKTIQEKRKKRLAKIGFEVKEPNIDNTTVTSAVVTEREAVVKARDDMPPLSGFVQPWSAILQRKRMTEKQIEKRIQKQILERREKTKKLMRKGLQSSNQAPIKTVSNQKVPCGTMPGQFMVPWEDIVGKYKDKSDKNDIDETDECDDVTDDEINCGTFPGKIRFCRQKHQR